MFCSMANSRPKLSLLIAVLLLALSGAAQAQDADPPSRVARLNFIEGAVSFLPAGTSDWLTANPNRPLTTGDQLWADQGSRGELHLGGAVLRVSSQTAISFLNLTDQAVQIQVAQGSASLRVRHLEDNETYEIDTSNLAFSILRPGKYRVDVSADGNTGTVVVESGAGEVTAGGQAYNAGPGQEYTFSGTDQVSYDAQPLPQPDNFEEWSIERDRREERFASSRYVSPDVIGYEDLDDHGSWRDDPEYGHVWIPNGVAEGWAPYRYGHWAYVAPWGWTWVEDEPWGFAPFHYGRWAIVAGGGWGWVPGPLPVAGAVYVRPVYAPALVAFVGGGFAAAIELGGPVGVGVAWFPLGPRDVWVPPYRASEVYVSNVNITNSRVINRTEITNVYNTTIVNNRTTNVNRTYMYQNSPNAVTAVPKTAFQNGEPVAKAAVRVNPQEIQRARVVETASVAPTPRAIAGASPPAKPSARPPATLASRPVVTRTPPSPRAIPVGQTKPNPTAFRSVANAKPATAQPAISTGSPPANHPPQPAAGGPPAQPNKPNAAPAEHGNQPPARANEPSANRPAQPPQPPNRTQPSARENQPAAHPNEPAPANRATPPTHENQPPAHENQPPAHPPARETQPPPRENQPTAHPPAHENQPPARANEPPANRPAQPPNRTQPPAHENQPPAHPPAHENQPPARAAEPPPNRQAPPPTRTQPPPHENAPRQAPPPEAKPAPRQEPPPKETKPSNEKNKEKEPPKS
jgi:hypothetical protein